jgi:phosphoribosylanthranilate isomerase
VGSSGVDYIGVIVEVPASRRSVTVAQAAEIGRASDAPSVTLFVNAGTRLIERAVDTVAPRAVQLHGHEEPEDVARLKVAMPCEVWKTLHLPRRGREQDLKGLLAGMREFIDAGADRFLLDTFVDRGGKRQIGGTGLTADWGLARELVSSANYPVFLAGGICPENVCEAIERVRPYGVDLSSGVESDVGRKDPGRVRALMSAVQKCCPVPDSDGGRSGA